VKSTLPGFNPEYGEYAPTLEEISGLTGLAVIEFGAPWCQHCKAAQVAIREVLSEHPELLHIKIYDGKGKPLGRAFHIKLWPTLLLLENGKEVSRLVRPLQAQEVGKLFDTKVQFDKLKPSS